MARTVTMPDLIATIRRAARHMEQYGTCSLIDGIAGWYWTRKTIRGNLPRDFWAVPIDQALIAMSLAAHVLEDLPDDDAAPSPRKSGG